jgi:hypothetical protein
MTLRTVPSDRDVRTRSIVFFRVDLGTRYVTMCGVSLVAGRSEGKRYRMRRMECGLWAGVGNVRTRSTGFGVDLGTRYVTVCVAGRSGGKLSAVFLQPIQNRGLYRTEE